MNIKIGVPRSSMNVDVHMNECELNVIVSSASQINGPIALRLWARKKQSWSRSTGAAL